LGLGLLLIGPSCASEVEDARAKEKCMQRLNPIILPEFEVRDATVQQAVALLRKQSQKHSADGRGLEIVIDQEHAVPHEDILIPEHVDVEVQKAIGKLEEEYAEWQRRLLPGVESSVTNRLISLRLREISLLAALRLVSVSSG